MTGRPINGYETSGWDWDRDEYAAIHAESREPEYYLDDEHEKREARIAEIRSGAETDPIELILLDLENDPDYRTFNIKEDW
jgi:hypothetical protein